MDPRHPVATHVAVRDGRILAVGDLKTVSGFGDYVLDDTFDKFVMLPGFVEGHAHVLAGGIWQFAYVGYHDRIDPFGRPWPGLKTTDSVVERLAAAAASSTASGPVVAWGYDPIFLPTERLSRSHLDAVVADCPVAVIHSNFHLMTVNSHALSVAKYGPDSDVPGLGRDQSGTLTGELKEMGAMFPVMRRLGIDFRSIGTTRDALTHYGEICKRCGVTTATDMMNDLHDDDVALIHEVVDEADYPARVVFALNAHSRPVSEIVERALALQAESSDKARFGSVKIITDGAIQGFTARLRSPGYYRNDEKGIWNIAPDALRDAVDAFHGAGLQIHIHVNGDEASEVAIGALKSALMRHPHRDHRHSLQHCQLADDAQFRKMRELEISVNLFANHLFYFGDQHLDITLGFERAMRIDACATALRHGLPLAIHSDAPVTPMSPLFTAWCATQRLTESGRALSASERISVAEALRAITLGAAYTLKVDHEIGSIEVGKRADFAILKQDPYETDPMNLKDIDVWGTVLAGRKQPVSP